MEHNFLVPCPEIMGNHLQQFFGSVKIHGSPPPKCFQFFKVSYFFLAPDAIKMADDKKLIDTKQHFNFI